MTTDSESSAVALQRYIAFVEEQTLAHRDALAQEMHEYQELRELLQELTHSKLQSLHKLLDIGEHFHVRAKVDDTSLVTVDIGLNFHVEMTVPA
ncbi:hypothetical protein KXD40_006764 [Peronospora effusa]|nr:hypothetical protein KXD40_006764 [Peronospora effusa]